MLKWTSGSRLACVRISSRRTNHGFLLILRADTLAASRATRLKPSTRQSWTISTPSSLVASAPLLAGMSFAFHGLGRLFHTSRCRYRRGKPASNDIDIVFTHPNNASAKGLCARLVERLRSAGFVKYVLRTYRPASLRFAVR